ncbi:hypothetical protein [Endozoicomonas sp. ALC020]|uniref:hypothetical protein n=1 Tax=unclassified Endozoicomonas TaxID=2644528 RepID=UPI003BB04323
MSQNSLQRGNELTPVIPGFILVIPEKAEIRRWRWIPAFAGMTTSEHGNKLLEFCDTLYCQGLKD